MDIWQFFRNFLAFQKASFQHFTSTIGTALSCQQWFLQAGRCATKEEKPLRATVCFSIEHARPRDITFSCKKHQQNNNFARTSQFFVHFFPFLHVYDVKKMRNFAFSYGERKSQARRNFILFRVWILWSLGIQLQVLFAHI